MSSERALNDSLDLYLAYRRTLDAALEDKINDPYYVQELAKYSMAMRDAWEDSVELVPADVKRCLRPRWMWMIASWRWRLTNRLLDDTEMQILNKLFIAYENLQAKRRRAAAGGRRADLPDADGDHED